MGTPFLQAQPWGGLCSWAEVPHVLLALLFRGRASKGRRLLRQLACGLPCPSLGASALWVPGPVEEAEDA